MSSIEIYVLATLVAVVICTKLFGYIFGRLLKRQRRRSLHQDSKGFWVWEGANGIIYRSKHHPDSPEGDWGERISTSTKASGSGNTRTGFISDSFGGFDGFDGSD